MRWFLFTVLITAWSVALAQDAPSPEPVEKTDGQEQVEGERAAEPAEEGAGEGSGENGSAEEPLPTEADDPSLADVAPPVETNPIPDPPEDDELADADEEFEPGEEISEDFPVPLPSDI